jgi:glycosyltransferase involved in cell wall biosynthesis
MAALALGKPTVTNVGHLSESLWGTSLAVQLAPTPSVEHLTAALEELLAQPQRWSELGSRGQELYRSRFSIDRCVLTLRSLAQ